MINFQELKQSIKNTPLYLVAGVLLANFLSIIATVGGFWLISSTNEKGGLSLGLIALFTALLLQLVIFVLLKESICKNSHKPLPRVIILAGYLLFESINFGISASTIFMLSGLENEYQRANIDKQTKKVEASIYGASANLLSLVSKFDELAQYSASTADIEDSDGGTCGGPAGPTQGKYWRLRQTDMQQASVHKIEVANLKNNAEKLFSKQKIANTIPSAKRNTLEKLAVDINKILDDSAISNALEWSKDRLDAITNGHKDPLYKNGNVTFYCPDLNLKQKLNNILSVKLTTADKPEFYITEGANHIKLTFSKLGKLASGQLDKLSSFDFINFVLSALLSLANPIFIYFYHKYDAISHTTVSQMHTKSKEIFEAITEDSLLAIDNWLNTLPIHFRKLSKKYSFFLEDDHNARQVIFGLQQLESMGLGKFHGHANLIQLLSHPALALKKLFNCPVPFLASFTPQEYVQLESLLNHLANIRQKEVTNA